MKLATLRFVLAGFAPALILFACRAPESSSRSDSSVRVTQQETAMKVQYLEIVTPDVDATCNALSKSNGVRFGAPVMELGNARTAALEGGGKVGVRAPMAPTEEPVVRPYVLVADIQAAVAAAEKAGAQIAHPPLEIPGQGTFAIYILGGIQHGLWQL
jgi:predicted enzyme related to lactoylglutathione lyase